MELLGLRLISAVCHLKLTSISSRSIQHNKDNPITAIVLLLDASRLETVKVLELEHQELLSIRTKKHESSWTEEGDFVAHGHVRKVAFPSKSRLQHESSTGGTGNAARSHHALRSTESTLRPNLRHLRVEQFRGSYTSFRANHDGSKP
jgi:hypothetical protein